MDVILELEGENSFSITVDPFDTFGNLKEKVQNSQHIPISHQNLFFNGQLLHDDLDVWGSSIVSGSRIQLQLAAANLAPPPPPPRVILSVKIPKSKDRVPIEMDLDDTVLKLKQKILARQDMEEVPLDRIVLQSHTTRVEFLDRQILKNCAVSDNHEMDVFLKPSLPVAGISNGTPGKLNVKVLPMRTKEELVIEVNATDKVTVLREQLEKLQKTLQFRLPEDGGYFFIHRQDVMYEEKSFQWHQVTEGDTIETFDGFVTTNAPKVHLPKRRKS